MGSVVMGFSRSAVTGFIGFALCCSVHSQYLFPTYPAPVATSKSFVPWARAYVEACIATAPIERPTNYYFSSSGNDNLGTGTKENPWKTLAKANAIVSLSKGNIGLRFHEGSVWRESTGLRINRARVSVSSYRLDSEPMSAPKPRFTRFVAPLSPSEWQSTGQPGSYWTPVANPVAWAKYWNDENTVLRRMTSLEDCYASAGSWFYESGKLYVHTLDDMDLTEGEMRIEYVPKNTVDGITVEDVDGVRIDGIRIEGYGAGTPGDHSYSGYGIRLEQTDAKRAVVTECDTFYNGRHSITKVVGPNGSSAGGSLVIARCRMGWLVNDGLCAISYSPLGGQELVSAYNEFLGGQLPNTNKPYPYGGSFAPHYLHTSNDALFFSAFSLVLDNKINVGPYMMNEVSTIACAPQFSDLKDCRSFVIGEVAKSRVPNALDVSKPSSNGGDGLMFHQLGARNTCYINCVVEPTVLWTQTNGDVCTNTSAAGVWINSRILFDFSYVGVGKWSRVLSVSSVTPNFAAFQASFYGCRLWFNGKLGSEMGFSGPMVHKYGSFYNNLAGAWNGRMVGSITGASSIGTGFFRFGFGNSANRLTGNSYANLASEQGAWGCDTDTTRVVRAEYDGPPSAGTERRLGSPLMVMGYPLEYDFAGVVRSSKPCVGPFESPQKQPFGSPIGG